jgi:hypothetical protein
MVTPPEVPEVGLTPVTDGVDAAVSVNRSLDDRADVAAQLVTVTSMVPAGLGGTTADRSVSLYTVNAAAGSVPKATAPALVNPVPPIKTMLPPPVLADVGDTDVTVGADTEFDVK